MAKVWNRWCAFWFESNSPENLRLFRIAFGSLVFCLYLVRSFDLELFYSDHGIMPLASVRDTFISEAFMDESAVGASSIQNSDSIFMQYRESLLFFFTSTKALWICNIGLLSSVLLFAFGFYPRLMALIAYVLHVSILHRNMAPSYGADMVVTFFLFYSIFVVYRKGQSISSILSSVAFRLMQIQVCIIYTYSGLDKARGNQWWGGEAIWGVVSNWQLARFDFSFMAHLPLIIVAATYITLAWEIYFPVLIWLKPWRRFILLVGVCLHLGIAFVVNIPFFSAVMMVSYLLFLEKDEILKIQRLFLRV